jgi:hypothetical protein
MRPYHIEALEDISEMAATQADDSAVGFVRARHGFADMPAAHAPVAAPRSPAHQR